MTDAPRPVPAAAESRHEPDDTELWNDSWYFDAASPDGSLGVYVRVGLYPNLGVTWYWAAVVRPGHPTVLVRDHEVPLPSGDLDLRTEGLWAQHVCEEPLEHWTLGAEAFGVALDDPADAWRGELGDRVGVGIDLEWETRGTPYAYPGVDRYEIPCRVHGEVLVGRETLELDGFGERDHSWGHRDWWTLGWWWTSFHTGGGTAWHGMGIDVPGIDYTAGFVQHPDREPRFDTGFEATDTWADDGLPADSDMVLDGLHFDVTPVAHAPLLLTAPDGRVSRLSRALCRFDGGDRIGYGWTEWNRPQ